MSELATQERAWESPPTPPYVSSPEQLERWRLCEGIALETSRALERSGQPDLAFVFSATRSLYFSDIPTDAADRRTEYDAGREEDDREPQAGAPEREGAAGPERGAEAGGGEARPRPRRKRSSRARRKRKGA